MEGCGLLYILGCSVNARKESLCIRPRLLHKRHARMPGIGIILQFIDWGNGRGALAPRTADSLSAASESARRWRWELRTHTPPRTTQFNKS